ncbi:MAG TPA: hypothetical protein VGL37_05605 [Solirubrobacteraceae bacterium]|jgi:hypothetical protein
MRTPIKLIFPAVAIAMLIAMSLATSAFAHQPPTGPPWSHPTPSSPSPTGPYAPFGECPLATPNVYDCLVGAVSGGELTFGKITVPINRTLTLQGGLAREPETENTTLAPAVDGETLSQTPLEVPGGLLHMLGYSSPNPPPRGPLARWSQAVNAVTVTLELVGPVQVSEYNLLVEEGPTLVLPARLRFRNPLLGNECFIGSAAEPLTLALTDGTTNPPPPNQPIKGSPGVLALEQEGTIATLTDGTFVNNESAISAIHGCGLFGALDGLLDHGIGLPSPAGSNTAIVEASLSLAAAVPVRESEQ